MKAMQLMATAEASFYVGPALHIKQASNVHVMGMNSQSGSVAIAAALQVFTVLGQHTCAMLVMRSGSCGPAA